MSSANSRASRDQQMSAVMATPPPRKLPPAVREAALSMAAPLSFGIFGALFGGFGLLLVWVFFPRNVAREWRLNAEETVQAPGVILRVGDTALTLNDQKVAIYSFEFRTAEGNDRHGECFTTGRKWKPGDTVDVIYVRNEPSIARPLEARLSRTNMGSMAVVLFPLGGAALLVWVLISRHRAVHAFVHGQVIEAFITDVEHTQTAINDYAVYKITFEQTDRPQEPIILRHWKPKVVAFLQKRRETHEPVFLLSDPRKPTVFFLPETL
jgi:hypothetical protein